MINEFDEELVQEIIEILIKDRPDYEYLNFCLIMDDYKCLLERLKGDKEEYEQEN